MRVDPRFTVTAPTSGPRRAGGSGFTLDGGAEVRASSTGASAATHGLGGIEALLVLQAENDPAERKKRVVQRGRDLLGALDRLTASILAGRIAPADLARIRTVLSQRREFTDDPRLDEVLAHIELRAEVELAKLGR